MKSYTIDDILKFIPEDRFAELARQTNADYEVKLLTGKRMFFLLTLCMLRFDVLTQRRVTYEYSLKEYQEAAKIPDHKTLSHNAVGYRLRNMPPEYFGLLYKDLYGQLGRTQRRRMEKQFGGSEIHDLVAVDSTLVSKASRYLTDYIEVKKPGRAHKQEAGRAIKYSFGFSDRGLIDALIFNAQQSLSENVTLRDMIEEYRKHDPQSTNIYLIDRGLNSSANFRELKDENVEFISRVNMNRVYEYVRPSNVPAAHPVIDKEVIDLHKEDVVVSDDIVRLRKKGGRRFDTTEYRLVKVRTNAPVMTRKGHRDRTDSEIWLLTDNMNLPPVEIVAFYGMRWRIECLFRFLKQRMSLNKFISGTPNGIANILYIILMTAMLVLLYARLNGYGYGEARDRLYMQLENRFFSITAQIIHHADTYANKQDNNP